MSAIEIRKISRERFNAFVDWTRSPHNDMISEELEWYSSRREFVLGVIVSDLHDHDFAIIALGRDESRRYRCIDLAHSIPALNTARARLKKLMLKHVKTKSSIFPQGDEDYVPVDLFKPVVSLEKMHPQFHRFLEYSNWAPATRILEEMMNHFSDVDGNFVEQFQTTGFDSRLWELYLFAYINEENLFLHRDHHAPDFVVEKYGKQVAIEAVTVNPTNGISKKLTTDSSLNFKSVDEVEKLLEHYMPIKFGSSLYSKLSKEPPYWSLDHVAGKPLVFAIADFHEAQSMIWSHSALWRYLYGLNIQSSFDGNGKLIVTPQKINTHKHGDKEIPSGFFLQENSENVSAVLFSNSGTISKFNRMGKLAGFGGDDITLLRTGFRHDHDPNATLPKSFAFKIKQGEVTESWSEGLNMYHNPNAIYPVPKELFPSIAHHEYIDGQIASIMPEFHPYSSITHNIISVKGKNETIDFLEAEPDEIEEGNKTTKD